MFTQEKYLGCFERYGRLGGTVTRSKELGKAFQGSETIYFNVITFTRLYEKLWE